MFAVAGSAAPGGVCRSRVPPAWLFAPRRLLRRRLRSFERGPGRGCCCFHEILFWRGVTNLEPFPPRVAAGVVESDRSSEGVPSERSTAPSRPVGFGEGGSRVLQHSRGSLRRGLESASVVLTARLWWDYLRLLRPWQSILELSRGLRGRVWRVEARAFADDWSPRWRVAVFPMACSGFLKSSSLVLGGCFQLLRGRCCVVNYRGVCIPRQCAALARLRYPGAGVVEARCEA